MIDLLPFGVSAIRIGAPRVQLAGLTPYPSEAVLTSMEARYHELSNQLARLNRGSAGGLGEPPNSGFEPDPSPPIQQTQHHRRAIGFLRRIELGRWRVAAGRRDQDARSPSTRPIPTRATAA